MMGDGLFGTVQSPRWEKIFEATPRAFLAENNRIARTVEQRRREFFVPELALRADEDGSHWAALTRYLDRLGFPSLAPPQHARSAPTDGAAPMSVRGTHHVPAGGRAGSAPPSPGWMLGPREPPERRSPRETPPERRSQRAYSSPLRRELFDEQSHRLFSRENSMRLPSTRAVRASRGRQLPRRSGRAASAAAILVQGEEVQLAPQHTPRGLGSDMTGKIVKGGLRDRGTMAAGMILTPHFHATADAAKGAELAAHEAYCAIDAATQRATAHLTQPEEIKLAAGGGELTKTTVSPVEMKRRADALFVEFHAAHSRHLHRQARTSIFEQQAIGPGLQFEPIDPTRPNGGDVSFAEQHQTRKDANQMAVLADRVLSSAIEAIVVPEGPTSATPRTLSAPKRSNKVQNLGKDWAA